MGESGQRRFAFPHSRRLTRGADLDAVRREGKRVRTEHLEVRAVASLQSFQPKETAGTPSDGGNEQQERERRATAGTKPDGGNEEKLREREPTAGRAESGAGDRGPGTGCRIGIIVPRYKHSAVDRNRLKRRLRELARTRLLPRLAGAGVAIDVVIRVRPDTYAVDFDGLARQVERAGRELVRKLGGREG